MSQPKEYFLSTSEAQANISKMLNFMENENDRFVITRYSKPLGVFLPYNQYLALKDTAKKAQGGACLKCNL